MICILFKTISSDAHFNELSGTSMPKAGGVALTAGGLWIEQGWDTRVVHGMSVVTHFQPKFRTENRSSPTRWSVYVRPLGWIFLVLLSMQPKRTFSIGLPRAALVRVHHTLTFVVLYGSFLCIWFFVQCNQKWYWTEYVQYITWHASTHIDMDLSWRLTCISVKCSGAHREPQS
jgi:hypothetical protein